MQIVAAWVLIKVLYRYEVTNLTTIVYKNIRIYFKFQLRQDYVQIFIQWIDKKHFSYKIINQHVKIAIDANIQFHWNKEQVNQ